MKKLVNSFRGIISLPTALINLGFYSLTKNKKKKDFYSLFVSFILHAIKTGKFEAPNAYVK